jgi:hypothetical protein
MLLYLLYFSLENPNLSTLFLKVYSPYTVGIQESVDIRLHSLVRPNGMVGTGTNLAQYVFVCQNRFLLINTVDVFSHAVLLNAQW